MEEQLTRADWVAHGFSVLKTEGHTGLKADRMAKALNVWRGSFYWHFKSMGAFHRAVIDAWRTSNTEMVIVALDALPNSRIRMTELISQVILIPQDLEAAMRSWAQIDGKVAVDVADVDKIRLNYLMQILLTQGLSPKITRSRATVLLWTYVGRALAPSFADDLSVDAAQDLGSVFLQPISTSAPENPE